MKFSVLCWNVEHLKPDHQRINVIKRIIQSFSPDIFCILEVEEKKGNIDVLQLMKSDFTDYNFYITEGAEVQELLIGCRKRKFDQVIFTQKREFQAYNPHLRPGAFLNLELKGKLYNLLFLHTDSGCTAPDFGNRAEMFEKIWKLKKVIDSKATNGNGNFIVMGDLNTMGLQYPKPLKSNTLVQGGEEIRALSSFAMQNNMQLLAKEHDNSWTNGKMVSNLDHAIASNNLRFTNFSNSNGDYQVRVEGWQQLEGQERADFIKQVSDHCALYIEVA